MPKLVQLYIRQCAVGFALSAGFVALLLWANVANLWHLVTHAEGGTLAVLLLWMFNGIVFASVQFGIAVMRMDDGPGRHDRGTPIADQRPVAIPVHETRRKRF